MVAGHLVMLTSVSIIAAPLGFLLAAHKVCSVPRSSPADTCHSALFDPLIVGVDGSDLILLTVHQCYASLSSDAACSGCYSSYLLWFPIFSDLQVNNFS